MPRVREEHLLGCHLDQMAQVKDCHAIGNVPHHAEVVRDEHVGEMKRFPQVGQQVQDLRLHGDIERADRLIEDQELRLDRQGSGDADALALAAAELVRVAVDDVRRETHELEQFLDSRAASRRGQAVDAFAHDLAHGMTRVER